MDGIASAGPVGAVMARAQLEAEYQARLLSKQMDVLKEQGGNAVKLIQSAAVKTAGQGQRLDVRI